MGHTYKIYTISSKQNSGFMDAKVTLRFDASIIEKGKEYDASQGISLSRLR